MAKGRPRKTDVVDRRDWQKVEVAHKKTGYFDPPAGINAHAKDVWKTYWDDPVSDIAATVDKSLIIRWIQHVSLYHELVSDYTDAPWVFDNQMRKRPNVTFTMANQVLKNIMLDEAQLGIGPKNRVAIGMTLASTARTLDAINNEYEGEERVTSNEPRVRRDPRTAHIVGRVE